MSDTRTSLEQPQICVSAETAQASNAVCNANPDAFRRAEYARLHDASDPTEQLLQEMFGRLISKRRDDEPGYLLVTGGLFVSRCVYVSAQKQGVAVERPDIMTNRPAFELIVDQLDVGKELAMGDMVQEFPEQAALCDTIKSFRNVESRVGALMVMGLYDSQLLVPHEGVDSRLPAFQVIQIG